MNGNSTIARKKALNGQVVEQDREAEAEPEFEHAGDDRVEEGVEHREPEHRVVPQPGEVLEADEDARAPDLGIGEAQPDAEAERIGQEQDQERRRRQHEPEADPVAIVLEPGPGPPGGAAAAWFARPAIVATLLILSSNGEARGAAACEPSPYAAKPLLRWGERGGRASRLRPWRPPGSPRRSWLAPPCRRACRRAGSRPRSSLGAGGEPDHRKDLPDLGLRPLPSRALGVTHAGGRTPELDATVRLLHKRRRCHEAGADKVARAGREVRGAPLSARPARLRQLPRWRDDAAGRPARRPAAAAAARAMWQNRGPRGKNALHSEQWLTCRRSDPAPRHGLACYHARP